MRETEEVRDKVVLVGLNSPVLKKEENADEETMEELSALVETAGAETVGMVLQNRYVMLAISVVLAPVIEETLLRGLVFGSIRAASRPMAYITSIFIFTMMHNWQYFGLYPFGSMLLSCLAYVPASAALCWTYEKAGTIWAPITIHAIINAISFGIVVLP